MGQMTAFSLVLSVAAAAGSPGAAHTQQLSCVPERGVGYSGELPPHLHLLPVCADARPLGKNE